MPPVTIEGVIENGQVRLPDKICLPDKTKVFVLIPDMERPQSFHVPSPRLVRPEDAERFVMEVTEADD